MSHGNNEFESRVYEYFIKYDYDNLLDAVVDYCEEFDVDYDHLHTDVKLSHGFKTRLFNEAKERKLVLDEESDHFDLDVL